MKDVLAMPCGTCRAEPWVKCDPLVKHRRRRSVDYSDIDVFSRLGDWVKTRGNAWVTATVRR